MRNALSYPAPRRSAWVCGWLMLISFVMSLWGVPMGLLVFAFGGETEKAILIGVVVIWVLAQLAIDIVFLAGWRRPVVPVVFAGVFSPMVGGVMGLAVFIPAGNRHMLNEVHVAIAVVISLLLQGVLLVFVELFRKRVAAR